MSSVTFLLEIRKQTTQLGVQVYLSWNFFLTIKLVFIIIIDINYIYIYNLYITDANTSVVSKIVQENTSNIFRGGGAFHKLYMNISLLR